MRLPTTLDAGYTVLAVTALADTVVSLFHCLRVLAPMGFDAPPTAAVEVLGRGPAVAVALCATAVVTVGLSAACCCRHSLLLDCCRD
ncbi:MAG: hypothetical protein ABIN96_16605 [Rubrivivax sp.]